MPVMASERASARLDALAAAAGDVLITVTGDAQTVVSGLAYDSRKVAYGDLFFCVPGAVTDGHAFAAAAVEAGAAALCVERPLGVGVPEIVVSNARVAMAQIAAEFFGRPSDDLAVIGVTGTNGKTTTTYLLESILAEAGRTTGLIGTVETRIANESRAGVRTTPESVDLQRLLWEMRSSGVDGVAMEVTSHALALHRVEGVVFTAGAFTNLSQDHLDFHADMEDYFAAKRSLFVAGRLRKGAVNVDDPYGRKLLGAAEVPCVGFGFAQDADVRAEALEQDQHGNRFTIVYKTGDAPPRTLGVSTALAGRFNVYNCLAACASALQAGIDPAAIARGLMRVRAVPGRFESIDEGQPFSVVVDYAHTPDSLDNVLRQARSLAVTTTEGRGTTGRVVCVFGCGGDRDRGKRPLMGAVAAELADVVVVTSDNPRSEDPNAIIDQILEGVLAKSDTGPDAVLPDRRDAIAHALHGARPGDVVVIAGKGHETGQQFADHTVPFDDRAVARDVLRDLVVRSAT